MATATASPAEPMPRCPLRGTEAIVHLEAIEHNLREVRTRLRPGVGIFAVVKADAYGHGSVPVAKRVLAAGAEGLCVALPQEAAGLREAGIRAPILVLGPVRADEATYLALHGVSITVAGEDGAQAAREGLVVARRTTQGARLAIHVKVDTGMGRLGLPPSAARSLALEFAAAGGPEIEGIFSHLSSADDDPAFTGEQIEAFASLERSLRPMLPPGVRFHLANSAGALAYPEAQFDTVRVGIAIYGYDPVLMGTGTDLRPALSLQSRVSFVKRVSVGAPISYGHTHHAAGPRTVATVPIGYADGVPRALTGQEVLVGACRYPIVGRVTMDQILLEGPDDWDVRVGDPVTLLGRDGSAEVWADAWALRLGTIPYEILTGLSPRVPRRYTGLP